VPHILVRLKIAIAFAVIGAVVGYAGIDNPLCSTATTP
jgi:hypothetical protein